jgi:hypothetical protein
VQDGRFLLTVDIGVLRTRPTFDVTNAQGDKTTIKQSMHIITSMVGLSYTLQKMKSE